MSDCAYCGGIKVVSAVTGDLSRHIPYELPCPECNTDGLVAKVAELVRELGAYRAEAELRKDAMEELRVRIARLKAENERLRDRLREAYEYIGEHCSFRSEGMVKIAHQWLGEDK